MTLPDSFLGCLDSTLSLLRQNTGTAAAQAQATQAERTARLKAHFDPLVDQIAPAVAAVQAELSDAVRTRLQDVRGELSREERPYHKDREAAVRYVDDLLFIANTVGHEAAEVVAFADALPPADSDLPRFELDLNYLVRQITSKPNSVRDMKEKLSGLCQGPLVKQLNAAKGCPPVIPPPDRPAPVSHMAETEWRGRR